MRVIFLTKKRCALRAGGIHLGLVDLFERSVEITPDGILIELIPFGEFLPVRFCFNEDFLETPPPQTELYYLPDGALVLYAHKFLRADQSLSVLWQDRTGGCLLTLVRQGKLQLNLENETGFHITELPDEMETAKAEITEHEILLHTENAFCLLSRTGEILLNAEGRVLSFGETLKAEILFRDSMGHSAVCEWEHGKLTACKIAARREATEATKALALFESALIGADCAPFLAPALKEKARSLKEYLGDFRSVVLTEERDKIGLVYPRKERVYDVKYYKITTEQGRINNIFPVQGKE